MRAEIGARAARESGQRGTVVNAALTGDYAAAGAPIKVMDGKFPSSCSGTLIGCRAFLIAAHCVNDRAVSKYKVLDIDADLGFRATPKIGAYMSIQYNF